MQCRKCGAKKTTRRRAGVFSCKRCGVQPGPFQMDRFGRPGEVTPLQTDLPTDGYTIAARQPKLRGAL